LTIIIRIVFELFHLVYTKNNRPLNNLESKRGFSFETEVSIATRHSSSIVQQVSRIWKYGIIIYLTIRIVINLLLNEKGGCKLPCTTLLLYTYFSVTLLYKPITIHASYRYIANKLFPRIYCSKEILYKQRYGIGTTQDAR
jgi:hypothetical protein